MIVCAKHAQPSPIFSRWLPFLETMQMIETKLLLTEEIVVKLSEFEELGGVIDYKIFKLPIKESELENHFTVATETLKLLAFESKLSTIDGMKITSEDFFGPYFNIKEQRPILCEKSGNIIEGSNTIVYINDYYYNDPEILENKVIVKKKNNRFITQGYADAFLQPPHSFGKKDMSNLELGTYFLDINNFLFSDINQIEIFSWSTNCNYFDDGKEWWGSFFWTVYNPIKDWHIGITASATD